MANKNYWIKLYHEILDDPKIGRLRVALKWRFIECLLVAGENGNEGMLPETADLAWRLRCDPEKLETDLNDLAGGGLLDVVDGNWRVTKFKKRQEPSKAALRMRRYRERKKEAKKEKETYTEADTESYRARNALRNGGVTTNIHSGIAYEHPPAEVPHSDRAMLRGEVVSAISGVVKDTLAIGINDADFERVADAVIDLGGTVKDVKAFDEYWEANRYYPGKPALKSFLQEFKNSMITEEAWWSDAIPK